MKKSGSLERLEAIRFLFESGLQSDIDLGLVLLGDRLEAEPENEDLFNLVIGVSKRKKNVIPSLKKFLDKYSNRGLPIADRILDTLIVYNQDNTSATSFFDGLIASADDAYYSGDYAKAKKIYERALYLDPGNSRVKYQLNKITLSQPVLNLDIPQQARSLFRRARSFISAGDVLMAQPLLRAAVEVAEEAGLIFQQAQDLLDQISDLVMSVEYKEKASQSLKDGEWSAALSYYQSASRLNDSDLVLKDLILKLQDLLEINAAIVSEGFNDKKIIEKLGNVVRYPLLTQTELYKSIVEKLKSPKVELFPFEMPLLAPYLVELGSILIAVALAFSGNMISKFLFFGGIILTVISLIVIFGSLLQGWKKFSSSRRSITLWGFFLKYLKIGQEYDVSGQGISEDDKKKRTGRLIRVFVIVMLFVIGAGSAVFVLPSRSPDTPIVFNDGLLSVDFSVPMYVIPEDDNIAEITVTNNSDTSIENVIITMNFVNARVKPAENHTTSVEIENLHSGSSETRNMSFSLIGKPEDESVDFKFIVDMDNYHDSKDSTIDLKVAPVPYLRKVSAFILGLLGLTAILQELLKKEFFAHLLLGS